MDRTRNDILNAFNILITKTDFDHITVSSITKQAQVSRATFYRYFKDKYDVMNENYKQLLDNLAHHQDVHNYRDLYYRLFFTARSEWKNMRYAFESSGVNSFKKYIAQYSKEYVEYITRLNRNGRGFTQQEELQIDVYCEGISEMFQRWIFGYYHLEPDIAADTLYNMMPSTLKDYWFIQ